MKTIIFVVIAVLFFMLYKEIDTDNRKEETLTPELQYRPLENSKIIILEKIGELFDTRIMNSTQGMKAYGSVESANKGELLVSNGAPYGPSLYDLDLQLLNNNGVFKKTKKQIFADVVKMNNGNYAYTDFTNSKILILNKDWEFIEQWGDGLELQQPIGIDQFSDGKIIIIDYGNYGIKLISNKGKLIRKIESIPGVDISSPYDVAIRNDKIYIVDRGAYRILVLNQNFELLDIIEKSKKGKYFFSYPQHIDFDNNGNLYIMDTNSNSVKVINVKNKELIATLVHEDIYKNPGIAIDDDNNIYISGFKDFEYLGADQKPIDFFTGIMVFKNVF